MNLFSVSDLKALTGENAADPAYNLARTHARSQLAWLHERIYGEIRARRWDLYFRPEWSLTPALVSPEQPIVDRLALRYTKAETVVRLMQKQLGGLVPTWDELSYLAVGLDAHGVFVEWAMPTAARLDALNFYNKVMEGAPEKRTLRQILAELGGEGALSLREDEREIAHVRCARLVDLGVLNTTLNGFMPGRHTWQISIRFLVTDPRLVASAAPDELLYRLAQLYSLHQFAAWSPRNNFVKATFGQSNSSTIP